MKTKARVISIFLILSIAFSAVSSLVTYADTQNDDFDFEIPSFESQIAAPIDFTDSTIAKIVDLEVLTASNHVKRLYDEEDLNTYVFENADGTQTLYVMDENVKYVAVDGTVHDKNIALQAVSEGYAITDNEFALTLPNSPTSGVSFSYAGSTLKLVPAPKKITYANIRASKSNNAVSYFGVFGSNVSLKYTPLLSGVKEDIILMSYTGVNSFDFTLVTDGMNVYEEDGGYYLAYDKASDDRVYLGDILVYDAVGKPDEGTLTVTTIEEGETYRLTVSADVDYLTDPSTVYPVTIDPTITVSDPLTGTNSIEDCPIYEGRPTKNHGTYTYNRVGYANDAYGVGRTAVRFTGLMNNSVYQSLVAAQIADATFYVRESSGGSAATVNLYPIYNTTWTESELTWNNIGSYSAGRTSTATMKGNQLTAFDIYSYIRSCKNGSNNIQGGLLMVSENETILKSFCSSEFGTSSKRPYVTVTYYPEYDLEDGTYYIKNMSSNLFMDVADPTAPSTTLIQQNSLHSNGSCERWNVEKQANGYYLIESVSCSNRYLSCSSAGSTSNIILTNYSFPSYDTMLWKFYKTASGNCCIIPKCDETSCFSLSTQASNNNLRKSMYINDSNLSDEWRFYYNAFTIKNYYDSTIIGNNKILNTIEEASDFVSYLYENLFQISITVDSAPTFYNNFVSDRCAHGVTALCNFCGANGSDKDCKSLKTVFEQITHTSKTYNQVIVMWANRPGNTIYDYNDTSMRHLLSSTLGVTNEKEDIYMFNIDISTYTETNTLITKESLVLAHEFAHTCNMEEQYYRADHQHDTYVCIMDRYKSATAQAFYDKLCSDPNDAFCDSCYEQLNNLTKTRKHYSR